MEQLPNLPVSKWVRSQFFTRTVRDFKHEGKIIRKLEILVRYDDDCNNGYNMFNVTGIANDCRSCMRKLIASAFPDLAPLLKWDLVTSYGPIHYFHNTHYYASQRDLQAARRSAFWPDATLEQLIEKRELEKHLPLVMAEFKQAMESLGFEY